MTQNIFDKLLDNELFIRQKGHSGIPEWPFLIHIIPLFPLADYRDVAAIKQHTTVQEYDLDHIDEHARIDVVAA